MNVLQEIYEWSQNRPIWQRDALRRLVTNGELSDTDIYTLTEICKSGYGLTGQQETHPLTQEHIPNITVGTPPISLTSIFHRHGVNALAENQTLKFAPELTVVFGDNGAGKTGYIRILKNACRARGQEQIMGNVSSGTSPLTPVVAINYKVGTEVDSREWSGSNEDGFISRVSVFDTQCAAVYLTEKTDVAFRPYGLDLFDKLAQSCKAIRSKLENEQREFASSILSTVKLQISEHTAAAKFLNKINLLTKSEELQKLVCISPDEEARLSFLKKSLIDLQANDPTKLIKQLKLKEERLRTLIKYLKNIEAVLSIDAVSAVFSTKTNGQIKAEEAKRLRNMTFPADLLSGTGSDSWKALWDSARQFSQESAYPSKTFPVTEDDARCVLCQQNLEHSAVQRLKHFKEFIVSTTEQELKKIRADFAELRKSFNDLRTTDTAIQETIQEIHIEHEAIAAAITAAIDANEIRRVAILTALSNTTDLPAEKKPELIIVSNQVVVLVNEVEARIKTLLAESNNNTKEKMIAEEQELSARQLLATHQQTILNEIERIKTHAAYGQCMDETKAQTITQKSTAVTKAVVSQQLKQSFNDELTKLGFNHIEVELKEHGGTDGVFYHKLIFTRAPKVDLPKVVSEGEQRCLSIAAFFAELSTADDLSGIVFDDPVSSLDYRWRQGVAHRLVTEAKKRQVIVFTHDVVFLLLLKQYAEELQVSQFDQHVRFLSSGAGVCTEELPWVAMRINKKIGFLKNSWQNADKLYRDGHQDAYEKEAKYLYGLLREAWERALEEVLLGGVVERYRPSIQTMQVAQIADITAEDCRTVETAMGKCSKWLTGHDQAAAARTPIPPSTELNADIETLEKWVKAIHSRRK
jgi:hypothetical protein